MFFLNCQILIIFFFICSLGEAEKNLILMAVPCIKAGGGGKGWALRKKEILIF